jgi:hypothetical protein
VNHQEAIQELLKNIQRLEKEKPSRSQIPHILNILKGVLLILDQRESSDSDDLLRFIKKISKKYKGATR